MVLHWLCISLIYLFIVPDHLMASLKMLACLARRQPGESSSSHSYCLSIYSTALCKGLRPRIIDLAKKGSDSVGSVAVEALVALKEPRESQLY